MKDLHLVLPAMNLSSTLNAGILIMMQQVRMEEGGTILNLLLFEFFLWDPSFMLKSYGWGGVGWGGGL